MKRHTRVLFKKLKRMKFKKYQLLFLLLALTFLATGQEKDYVRISNGKIKLAVDLEVGGRVMEYSKNGNNVIFVRTDNDVKSSDPDGGRCDFGPEKLAPPHPETWLGKWELVEKKSNYIKIKSPIAKTAGVQLVREFTLDKKSSHLEFVQTIINVSDSPKRYCHWSRTFGERNGICLAPLNPNSRFPKGYMVYVRGSKLDFGPAGGENERVRDGVLEILGPPENPKFVTDGSDWLAYVTQDNQLFVKKFKVFDDKVYGEMTGATVSLWYNKDGICEIEPIGPWEWIEPGKSISFTEDWYLTDYKYPENKQVDLDKIRDIIREL